MAVYVDNMYTISLGQFGRMKMSHMIADSKQELLEMVDKIGIQRKWIQHEDTAREHFDISKSKRELAIKYGAISITWRQYGEVALKRIQHGTKEESIKSILDQMKGNL